MRLFDYLTDVRWFAFSPDLAKTFTPTGAILLCWVIWKARDAGGEVEATVKQISEETGLSERNIETAKGALTGILKVRCKRFEHKTFYSIDSEELQKHWESRERTNRPLGKEQNVLSAKDESSSRSIDGKNVDLRTERKEKRTSALPPLNVPGPVVGGGARKTSRNAQPSPEAKAVIQSFGEVYRARFRSPYMPDPKADVAAAMFFLDAGVTADQVARTFEAATRSRTFWASRTTTLPILFRRWNEIQAELAGPVKDQPPVRLPGQPETEGEAFAREMREDAEQWEREHSKP